MPLTEDQKICLDCGICCRYLTLIQGTKNKEVYQETIQFYANWGCVVLKYDDGVHFEVAIPYPCRYLNDNKCIIYEERPSICRKMNKNMKSNSAFLKRNCKLGDKSE